MHGEVKSEVLWLPAPEDQDYPNASSYLSLLGADDVVGSEHGHPAQTGVSSPVTASRSHTALAGHQTER
ncbi:MAG: hypothetical protein JWO49_252 [Arthrobacter sp.]|nr:hypothetical protein [Arthrobacter sp.]